MGDRKEKPSSAKAQGNELRVVKNADKFVGGSLEVILVTTEGRSLILTFVQSSDDDFLNLHKTKDCHTGLDPLSVHSVSLRGVPRDAC